MEIKHQEAMQLMPGMQCITPKRPDMEVTGTLYGDMVASVVVSMREVVGKRSHWDIYEMKPMDTPNPNYFMNRLHVHNGPSNWPIPPSFGSELDIYGHWDVSHPSSFPSPSSTIYDLTSRGNIDAIRQPGSTAVASHTLYAPTGGYTPLGQNAMKEVPMSPNKGFVFLKQPGNPYHTGPYGFFGPSSFSVIMTFRSAGPHPPYARLNSTRPGYNFEVALRSPGQVAWYVPGWRNVTPPTLDLIPAPQVSNPNPKVSSQPSYNILGIRYHGNSSPYRWYFLHGRTGPGTAFGVSTIEPAPQTQPRTPDNRWGVFGNVPGPTATNENVNGHFSEMIFLGNAQPGGNYNELAENLLAYYNTDPGGSQMPLFWQTS
jgi:hypothetical protein